MNDIVKKIEGWLGLNQGDILDILVSIGTKLIIAAVILWVGFKLSRVASKTIRKGLEKRNIDLSLVTFLSSLITTLIKVLTIITAITQLGLEMTSFVALLGAAGLAVGMAFSGTLSNFAGGVIILFLKPFKIGDYVSIGGHEGIVKEILIFNTILNTLDNKTIILANGEVANGTIINYTNEDIRRVDWTFGVAYGDNLKKAKEVLMQFMEEDKRILKDPAPFVGLGELADSSVNITTRAWVKTEDYWDVFFDMNERVYNEFEKEGLSIPFPQMDVHLKKES